MLRYSLLFSPNIAVIVTISSLRRDMSNIKNRLPRGTVCLIHIIRLTQAILASAVSEHCVNNLLEACDVSADNIVALVAVAFCGVVDVVVDVDHDVFEFCVNLFECP